MIQPASPIRLACNVPDYRKSRSDLPKAESGSETDAGADNHVLNAVPFGESEPDGTNKMRY